jgi:elongation factor G
MPRPTKSLQSSVRTRRNIGIMAHVDAGKTTLTERILFDTGRLHRIGEVHDGKSAMDWRALEKKHGITISAAATSCQWRDADITIIDTPGHADFTIEVERSLRVLDAAVAVFSAVAGVEPQSETVWRQADRFGVPRLCFINKMDQVGADFLGAVAMLRERLAAQPLVLQLPIGAAADFRGVIDLVSMRALVWNGTDSAPAVAAMPEQLLVDAQLWRQRLLEQVVELDDAAVAQYLEAEHELSETYIRDLIRIGCVSGRFQPVLCGAAYRNIGVQPLLDAVVDFCPAPSDRPPVEGLNPRTGLAEMRAATVAAPLTALVSKVQMSRYGALSYVRIYSGRMRSGMLAINGATGERERIGRLLRMHANQETEVDEAEAGDVIAVVGLRLTGTGETLCDAAHPIVLNGFVCPEPVIEAVIAPRLSTDHDRLGQALAVMTREDPSLRVATCPESGQTLVRGMGELHLMICVETLKEDHNVDASIGPPRVAYREAISRAAEVDYTHRKQNGGTGQMARVRIVFEPYADGLLFENRTVGGTIPREFVPGIEKGLRAAMQTGGLIGYPVLGLKATLVDGAFHAKDSSALAFELATRHAFREAFERAAPVLLEPIMRVSVTTPGDAVGAVMGDLQSRRGCIVASEPRAGGHDISADVPLANMFNYVSTLRSQTQGRATFTMTFGHYAALPKALQSQMVAATG